MKRVKIYAPTSGIIKDIKSLNDGVFSKGMLGVGCYIIPENNDFFSPFESGELKMIFPTKHAYYVKSSDGPTMLIHIGIDTVTLEGKPFEEKAALNDMLNLQSVITSADLDLIKENNLKTNTPLVIDTKDYPNATFNLLVNDQRVEQGQLIGEFVFEEAKPEKLTVENLDLSNQKSIYEKVAEEIYHLVGEKGNYTNVYNCMTRLRFEIKSKDKVNVEKIKNIKMVKGINWAGNQIQIIIGGEVYKVKDSLITYVDNLNKQPGDNNKVVKKSFGKRMISALGGIMLPSLPVILTAGMLMGIKSLLVLSGAMQDIGTSAGQIPLDDANVFSAIFYIIAEIALKFLGVFIGYNTAKYLGANSVMQLFISLAIANPIAGIGASWLIFEVGDLEINAQIYTSSILPHIASAIMLYHFEKWVKTWMPTSIDVIFRPLVVFSFVTLMTFFLVGPMLYLVEQGVTFVVANLGKIPFGFGVAVYAFFWQPLVMTGMHIAVVLPISLGVAQGIPNTLMAGISIATFGQVGAVLAVAIRTKNAQLKQTAYGSIPAGIVGITEPIIYGINFPKIRPFIAAVTGSAVGGLFSGLMGAEARNPGGLGIFSLAAYISDPIINQDVNGVIANSANNAFTGEPLSLVMNIIWYVTAILITLGTAFGMTVLMYRERPLEKQVIKHVNKNIIKYYALANNISIKEATVILSKYINALSAFITKEDLDKIALAEKGIIKVSNSQTKLDNLFAKEEAKKQALFKKIKAEEKKDINKQNKEKILKLKQRYVDIVNNSKTNELEENILKLKNENLDNMKWLTNFQTKFMEQVNQLFEFLNTSNLKKYIEINELKTNYKNGIKSLNINYELENKEDTKFSKKIFIKHIKNNKQTSV